MAPEARRVTIAKADDGLWHMKVQSTGWRVMFDSKIGTDDSAVLVRLAQRKWPEAELVIER